MQREKRRQQYPAANAGQSAEQTGSESKDDQKYGHHAWNSFALASCSMELVGLEPVSGRNGSLAGTSVRRKLRHRPG